MRTLIIAVCLLLVCHGTAWAGSYERFLSARDEWGLTLGFGETIPDMGATRSRVEAIDFTGKYGYFLTGESGEGWYRGRHEILFELPVHYVYSPKSAYIASLNVFAVWNFTALGGYVPYVFGGGGPVYTNLDVPELGSRGNGTYQFGAGLRWLTDYQLFGRTVALDLNGRYHHISNADTAHPNGPLNSLRVRAGIILF